MRPASNSLPSLQETTIASGASVIPAFAFPSLPPAGNADDSMALPPVCSSDVSSTGDATSCDPALWPSVVETAGLPPPIPSAICCNTSASVTAVKCQFCPFMALGALMPAERILSTSSSTTSLSVNAWIVGMPAISSAADRPALRNVLGRVIQENREHFGERYSCVPAENIVLLITV